jgi:hypothetical protein
MPDLDVAFLVIVTTSVRLLLSRESTDLICDSALLCIFKPELSVAHLLALAHLASQSGAAWQVICVGNPGSGRFPHAQLPTPKRANAISKLRRTYPTALFLLGHELDRPPATDQGGGKRRAVKTQPVPAGRERSAPLSALLCAAVVPGHASTAQRATGERRPLPHPLVRLPHPEEVGPGHADPFTDSVRVFSREGEHVA